MAEFDPLSALLGGCLIGIASALLMVLSGRIAGISGILGGALSMAAGDKAWRLAFLVGFGTRLGGGCTSGHGVCGMARLSRRSIVATIVFMASAAIVVAIVRHGPGG